MTFPRSPARRGVCTRGGGGHAQVGGRRRRRVVQGRRAEAAVAGVPAKVRSRFLKKGEKRKFKIAAHLTKLWLKMAFDPYNPHPA